MAVATADFAFLDFGNERRQGHTAPHKTADLFEFRLRVDVIKLEDTNVCLTAIDAVVRDQIVGDEFDHPGVFRFSSDMCLTKVVRTV
ncbi:MAG TPA: hypothetical protein VEU77_03925 [Candidatus Acidoferrales bacterium]|nr:hypothetical protein [Candidatus Acidoferrales bacterium]